MKDLYVSWQDRDSRRWYTIGCLSHIEVSEQYRFVYTKGAEKAREDAPYFKPFTNMNDLYREYFSTDLFPVFANRILSHSRPNFQEHLEWLGLNDPRPLDILERSGGERATDQLQVYAAPTKTADNKYKSYFFVRGMSHLPEDIVECTKTVKKGQLLYPMHDFKNEYDEYAVALRRDKPVYLLGYCPRYLSNDLLKLAENNTESVKIVVDRINPDAPFQMRMRCKFEADWPSGFTPFGQDECKPLVE